MSDESPTVAQSTLQGRLLLLTAAVLWSTSGLFLKSPALSTEFPAAGKGALLACYRAMFAAAVLVPFVRIKTLRWRPVLLPMSVSFAVMNLVFVMAMGRTTSAACIFLQYTSTVWAFLLAVVFLREKVDRGNLFALACAVVGIGWIVAGDWGGANFVGNMLAIGSGLTYAIVVLCLRVLRDENSAWLIALNHLVSFVVLLPWVWSIDVELTGEQWLLIALLGGGQMGMAYTIFARAVRSVTVQEAALVTLLEPVLNPVWVWLVWGEAVSNATWIGGTFILGGLAVRYLLFVPTAKS